jgi:hypothetical protein
MSKSLVLSLLALAFIATSASAAVRRDRDRDRLPDRWEKRHHLSTHKKSAKKDNDRDGLRNLGEYRHRTRPHKKDTDRDGLRDGAEVRRYHTNPRKKDTDGDGYSDGAEVRAGTNPRNRKSHPSTSSSPPASPGGLHVGVPPGTALTPSGGMTISTAGAVINARDISGQVVVRAPNVTIRNSRIRSNAMWAVDNNSTGLVIENSEIINRPTSGQPNCHNGIGDSNFTVRQTEITGCENGMNISAPGNVTFTDNYIHDLDRTGPSYVFGNSPHTDGIQVQEGASNFVIRHNWIDPSPGGGATSGIIMCGSPHCADGGGHSNALFWVEDNYIDGRGASYAYYAPRNQTHDGYVNRNRMLKGYGYTACVRLGVTVTTFNGNQDAISGAPLSPDNGAGGSCSN